MKFSLAEVQALMKVVDYYGSAPGEMQPLMNAGEQKTLKDAKRALKKILRGDQPGTGTDARS